VSASTISRAPRRAAASFAGLTAEDTARIAAIRWKVCDIPTATKIAQAWNAGQTARAIAADLGLARGLVHNALTALRAAGVALREGDPGLYFRPVAPVRHLHPVAARQPARIGPAAVAAKAATPESVAPESVAPERLAALRRLAPFDRIARARLAALQGRAPCREDDSQDSAREDE
jgi:hypothetical protein